MSVVPDTPAEAEGARFEAHFEGGPRDGEILKLDRAYPEYRFAWPWPPRVVIPRPGEPRPDVCEVRSLLYRRVRPVGTGALATRRVVYRYVGGAG